MTITPGPVAPVSRTGLVLPSGAMARLEKSVIPEPASAVPGIYKIPRPRRPRALRPERSDPALRGFRREVDRRSPPQRGGVDAIVPERRQLVVQLRHRDRASRHFQGGDVRADERS